MKAFVLAAGFGTRLRPLTDHIPKPLAPIQNIPALYYTFALLKKAGISEIICNIHHHANHIRRQVEEAELPGLKVSFSEEREILGTGGGLKRCEKLLEGGDFILVNSDIITDIDFSALIARHQDSGMGGTLCLHPTPDAATIGAVGIDGERINDFRNLRGTGCASPFIYTGTAILGPEIFPFLEPCFSGIVETGFISLAAGGRLGWHRHEGLWQDIGTPDSYLKANTSMPGIRKRLAPIMLETLGLEPHPVAPDAEIAPSAEFPRSVIGAGCRIGRECRASRCVLLPGTCLENGTNIENAIVHPSGTLTCSPW